VTYPGDRVAAVYSARISVAERRLHSSRARTGAITSLITIANITIAAAAASGDRCMRDATRGVASVGGARIAIVYGWRGRSDADASSAIFTAVAHRGVVARSAVWLER
jgi:hypothetical protein